MATLREKLDSLNSRFGVSSEPEQSAYSGTGETLRDKLSALNSKFGVSEDEELYKMFTQRSKSVSNWAKRFDTAMSGFTDYDKKRNGGYTQDASGGFGSEIDSLIHDFDSIRGYAGRFGLPNAQQYLKQLQQLKQYIGDTNATMAQFSSEDDYNTAVRYSGYYQKYNGQTYGQLKDTLSKLEDGEEKDWLTEFAPQTMTDRDFGIQAAQYNTGIYYAQKYLDEIKKAGATYGDGDPQNDLILRNKIKELNEEYGFHSRQEAEIALKQLEKEKQDLDQRRAISSHSIISGYDSIMENGDFGLSAASGWQKYLRDQEAQADDKDAAKEWLNRPHFGVSGLEMASLNLATDDSYKLPSDQWTMEEKGVYGYLYGLDPEKAEQFAIETNNYYNGNKQNGERESVEQFANDHPVASTVGGIFSGAAGLGMADFLTAGIEKFARGTNTQRSFVSPHQAAETATGTVAQNLNDQYGTISESVPVLGGHGLGDAYQLLNSIITSSIAANTVGTFGTDAVFFGNAAASAMDDARSRGATDEQALLMALISGSAEAAGEHFSTSHLLEMTDSKTIKQFFGTMFGQALEEGEEELFTSFVNNLADNYIMRDKSNFNRDVEAYKQNNPDATDEEAKKAAWKQMWCDMAFDFLGGFVSGGVHTAGQTALNRIESNANYHSVYGGSAAQLVQEGLASPEGTDSRALAEKLQQKMDSGEELSGSDLRRLVQANEQQIRAESLETDGFYVGQNAEKGRTEITFSEKPSEAVQTALKENGFKWSKKNKVWYGNVSQEQARQIAQNALGKTETAGAKSSETFDSIKNNSIVGNNPNVESKTAKNDSIRQAPVEDKPFELSDETGKTLLNLADGSTVETEITGIASTGKGKLMLNVAGQSEPVRASSISYASTADATLYNAINSMEISPEDAKRFVNLARSSGDTTGQFSVGIQQMYILGKSGVPISKAMNSSYGAKLSDTNKRFGYGLGRALYNAQVQKAEAEKKNVAAFQRARAATGGTKVNGVQYDGLTVSKGKDGSVAIDGVTLNEQQKAGIQAAEMLAKMGVNIHVFQSRTDANGKPIGEHGSYHLRDGSIHIDLNAGNLGQGVMAYTIAHEFTHFMEQQSPAKFQAFTDALFAELDVDVEAEIERKAEELKRQQPEQYKNASRETLLTDARSEVVAEACETMLTDTDAAQRIGQSLKAKDATLFEKVVQWFRDLAAKLREAYKGLHPDNQIAQYAKKTIQQVDCLVQMWADMAVDAAENYSTTDGEKNTTMDSGVKLQARSAQYDYSKSFSDQVDDYKNNLIPNGDSLVVGPTPEVFQKIGFNSLPVTINTTHVDYALYGTKDLDHFLGETALKSLPQSLKDPVAVFVSQTQKNTSVVALLKFTTNGKQTVVPVLIDGYSRQNGIRIDSNAITSVFGKTNAVSKLLYDAVNDESNGKYSLLYWNKKEAISLLQRARLQLPGGLMPRDGFIHSIRESSSPVKAKFQNVTETQQFKRWFGDWQKHPDRASKIVNADGTPKIVYHQTSSDFTIFDTRHEGAGTRDSDTPFGIFMKSSDKDIGLKGGKQMALYARIANPLVVQNREELISRLRTISSDYSQAADELRDLNADYSKKIEDAKEAWNNYMAEWRKEHPGASRKALYDDERFNQLFDAEDELIDEWESEARKIETRCKEAITRDLEAKGYDGVIIKQDKGSFGRTTDAYIALHPEQVKSATDNIGTFDKNNPDIRYSQRQQDQQAALEKQNGKLRDDVERLRELLKLQGKTTGGKLFKPESIKTAANFIMRETGRSLDADGKSEFTDILTKAYTALSDENVTYDDIIRECTNVAQWLDENGETQDALDEYAGGILSEMKGIPIRLDETQKAEARRLFGSLREFRSRIAGTYKLSPDGVPLDDVWNGLSIEHPMFFDGDASSAGLPGLLVEAIDRLRGSVNTDPYQHMPVDMMMRKVYDGFWKAKKLTTVADRYQSKIDAINAKHDAAMREMQEAHKAEIADLNRQWDAEAAAMEKSHKYDLEEQERIHKEHLRQVREKMNHDAEVELEKVIGQYRDQRKASVENRHRTQYREQIYKMADKFHKMATAPAKANTAHAPIQLVNAVAKFCEIFADSEVRALEYAANRLDSRETDLRLMNDLRGETKTRLKEADAINRQRERLYKKHQAVSAMKEQYSKIQNDPAFGMFYDEHVNGLLESLSKQLDGTDIYDMDTEQLKQVYSTMQAMMYTITNANRVFSMEKDKTLIGVTRKLAGEIDANKISHGAFVSGLRDYGMWQMSPDTFFNFVCGFKKGNEGKAIQRMFVDGSDRMLTVQRDFYQMFRHLTEAEDKNVRKHIAQMMKNPMKEMIDWGMKDAAGNPVKTTRDMMIQAYMLLNQKDSFDSMIYGGFALPNAKDYYNGKIDRAYGNAEEYQLLSASIENEWNELVRQIRERQDAIDSGGLDVKTVNQLQEEITSLQDQAIELAKGSEARLIELRNAIEAKLTEADLDAIETAKRWYKYAGKLMSDVHMQMYGYRPNLVDGYVPIHRDLSKVKTDIREVEEDKAFNLENSGFTKDRVKSRAPILLTGFFQELQSQQIKISRYYGFAQVQKDFNRIWNMRVPGYGMTINGKVAAKFGTGKRWLGVSGEQYVLNYIQSVAGVKGNEDILSSFYGNAASATLSANPRVAVSQLASIPTAAAVVGWKSMAKGFAKGVSTSISTEKKNLLANDSVWFFQRYRGAGGITEISDLKAKGGFWGKIANSKVGKGLFNWCQSMDVFATASMWAMAEDYVQQGGMKTTDDGYKLAVEQCYADIIRRSQPNYTVTERSDLLRDKRGGMKLLTMYKTQSNQNLNILINSIGEYRAAATAMRSVKNETTIADFKAAKNNLINGVTSVAVGGTLVFVLLRTMINFIMAKVDPYRDDETDELTTESAMGAIIQEAFSSIFGMFALGGQLYDIVNSVISGDNYYGISDSAISNLTAVPESMVSLVQRWKDPDKDVEWKHVEKVLSSSLSLCGIPYKNLRSFYDAAAQWYRDLKGGTFWQYIVDATDEQYSARILKAWQSDDMEKINDTLAILAAKSDKDTDEDILKDVTHRFANKYLKDKVKDDEISPEDAADLLKYIGHDDPDGVVQKWVFQVRHPDIDSNKITSPFISAYNQRGDISEKVFMDAYWFASSAQADKDKDGKSINGSKKAKIVKYIRKIPGLSFEQQKRLYILLDVGSLKDTPWE